MKMSERRSEKLMNFGPEWLHNLSQQESTPASGTTANNRARPPPARYLLAEYRYGREEMLALFDGNASPPILLIEYEGLYIPRTQLPVALQGEIVEVNATARRSWAPWPQGGSPRQPPPPSGRGVQEFAGRGRGTRSYQSDFAGGRMPFYGRNNVRHDAPLDTRNQDGDWDYYSRRDYVPNYGPGNPRGNNHNVQRNTYSRKPMENPRNQPDATPVENTYNRQYSAGSHIRGNDGNWRRQRLSMEGDDGWRAGDHPRPRGLNSKGMSWREEESDRLNDKLEKTGVTPENNWMEKKSKLSRKTRPGYSSSEDMYPEWAGPENAAAASGSFDASGEFHEDDYLENHKSQSDLQFPSKSPVALGMKKGKGMLPGSRFPLQRTASENWSEKPFDATDIDFLMKKPSDTKENPRKSLDTDELLDPSPTADLQMPPEELPGNSNEDSDDSSPPPVAVQHIRSSEIGVTSGSPLSLLEKESDSRNNSVPVPEEPAETSMELTSRETALSPKSNGEVAPVIQSNNIDVPIGPVTKREALNPPTNREVNPPSNIQPPVLRSSQENGTPLEDTMVQNIVKMLSQDEEGANKVAPPDLWNMQEIAQSLPQTMSGPVPLIPPPGIDMDPMVSFTNFNPHRNTFDIEGDTWYYRDPKLILRGPFTSSEMGEWYEKGYFTTNLFVRRARDVRFVLLGHLISLCGGLVPFLLPRDTLSKIFENIYSGDFDSCIENFDFNLLMQSNIPNDPNHWQEQPQPNVFWHHVPTQMGSTSFVNTSVPPPTSIWDTQTETLAHQPMVLEQLYSSMNQQHPNSNADKINPEHLLGYPANFINVYDLEKSQQAESAMNQNMGMPGSVPPPGVMSSIPPGLILSNHQAMPPSHQVMNAMAISDQAVTVSQSLMTQNSIPPQGIHTQAIIMPNQAMPSHGLPTQGVSTHVMSQAINSQIPGQILPPQTGPTQVTPTQGMGNQAMTNQGIAQGVSGQVMPQGMASHLNTGQVLSQGMTGQVIPPQGMPNQVFPPQGMVNRVLPQVIAPSHIPQTCSDPLCFLEHSQKLLMSQSGMQSNITPTFYNHNVVHPTSQLLSPKVPISNVNVQLPSTVTSQKEIEKQDTPKQETPKPPEKKKDEPKKKSDLEKKKRKEHEPEKTKTEVKNETSKKKTKSEKFTETMEKEQHQQQQQQQPVKKSAPHNTPKVVKETTKEVTKPQLKEAPRAAAWVPIKEPSPDSVPKMSLIEIQRLEREQKAQQMRELQIMMAEQQAAAEREKQLNLQSLHLRWVDMKPSKPKKVKSVVEIQEEQKKLMKVCQPKPVEKETTTAALAPTSGGIWGPPTTNSWWQNSNGAWEPAPAPSGPQSKTDLGESTGAIKKVKPIAPPTGNKSAVVQQNVKKDQEKQNKQSEVELLIEWSKHALSSFNNKLDVAAFVAFLTNVDDPFEINEYIICYLGENKTATDFCSEFIEKRLSILRQNSHKPPPDDLSAPAAAVNPGIGQDSQDAKGKKKVKKNKMFRIDVRNLGFNVTAATDRFNVGDIDSV